MKKINPLSAGPCPLADLERENRDLAETIEAASDKASSAIDFDEREKSLALIYHAEDRQEAIRDMSTHRIATSKSGLLFQMDQLRHAGINLSAYVERREDGEEVSPSSRGPTYMRQVSRMIENIEKAVKGLVPNDGTITA